MTSLERLQLAIEPHLKRIEAELPSTYRLTLVARNVDYPDRESDLLLTRDEITEVEATLRFIREKSDVCEHGVTIGGWCAPCNREYKEANNDPANRTT